MTKDKTVNVPVVRDKMAVHYSSKKVEWETPQDFFDKYNAAPVLR